MRRRGDRLSVTPLLMKPLSRPPLRGLAEAPRWGRKDPARHLAHGSFRLALNPPTATGMSATNPNQDTVMSTREKEPA